MADYERIISGWPDRSQEATKRVVDKYGPPDEATERRLVWHGNGPWKRTVVARDPVPHNWPMEHDDVVESVLPYRVPADKVGELAFFHGSIIVDRTKGELSARCEGEEANLLALNLAHEIIQGKRDALQARKEYANNVARERTEGRGPYMLKLMFTVRKGNTADPDTATLDAHGNSVQREEALHAS